MLPVKKGLSAKAASKKVYVMEEGLRTVNESVAQNWFIYFKKGDTSFKETLCYGRRHIT